MSRGGRGGGRGGRGGMHRNPLPFDVDMEVFEATERPANENSDDNEAKQLFPSIELVTPRPMSSREREIFRTKKELKAKATASIFWTGTEEQNLLALKDPKDKGKRGLDAFDSMVTYSKAKRTKQADSFVPLHKRKFPKQNLDLTPRELKPVAGAGGVGGGTRKDNARKSVNDRLANINENKDDEGGDDDNDSVDGAKAADGEDAASEPQDSDFSEDEADDADNDYNAENYFSGGEGDDGDEGPEDADDGY